MFNYGFECIFDLRSGLAYEAFSGSDRARNLVLNGGIEQKPA